MHVDRTLPLWAFFDVYGNVQKVKVIGKSAIWVFVVLESIAAFSLEGTCKDCSELRVVRLTSAFIK